MREGGTREGAVRIPFQPLWLHAFDQIPQARREVLEIKWFVCPACTWYGCSFSYVHTYTYPNVCKDEAPNGCETCAASLRIKWDA